MIAPPPPPCPSSPTRIAITGSSSSSFTVIYACGDGNELTVAPANKATGPKSSILSVSSAMKSARSTPSKLQGMAFDQHQKPTAFTNSSNGLDNHLEGYTVLQTTDIASWPVTLTLIPQASLWCTCHRQIPALPPQLYTWPSSAQIRCNCATMQYQISHSSCEKRLTHPMLEASACYTAGSLL